MKSEITNNYILIHRLILLYFINNQGRVFFFLEKDGVSQLIYAPKGT